MKIEPRKTTDRGGYMMMPLRANIPEPKNSTWKLSKCPKCGAECWETPLPEGYTEDMFDGKLCTMCGLKEEKGLGFFRNGKYHLNQETMESADRNSK